MFEHIRMGNEVPTEHRRAVGEVGKAVRRREPVNPMFKKGIMWRQRRSPSAQRVVWDRYFTTEGIRMAKNI